MVLLRYIKTGRDIDLYIRSTVNCSMQEVSSVLNSCVLPGDGSVGLEHVAVGVLYYCCSFNGIVCSC